MSIPRGALARALLPFALHGLAREVDAAVGLLLHTTLDLPGFVPIALGLIDPVRAAAAVAGWTLAGAAVWMGLAGLRARRTGAGWSAALADEAGVFAPLYLRPAITLLALAALAVQPAYPYGFTLPVAFTQDWGIAQDVAAAAALVAWRRPRLRLPVPGAGSLGLLAFLVYVWATPESTRRWENHPGNEPKTLRMAVAAGHWLTFDTEPVTGAMEDLPVDAPATAAARLLGTTLRESGRMVAALLQGEAGAGAIRATRITRQVVRGKEGGVFTVLAPGPSALLAVPLRIDRAWNRAHGTPGRLGFTMLAWNALAAALVAACFQLLREASGRPGPAALLAGAFALLPPFIFYSFQFYPEMLGALAFAVLLRALLYVRHWPLAGCLGMGLLLAALPWLHQKFLPAWLMLSAMAIAIAVHRLLRLPCLLALALPQLASGYLVALYNFAVTGSVRPDALYLAWGPRGVSSARLGQGLLGLWLDARYGLLPYVPLLALGLAALTLAHPRARRLLWALPAMLAYDVTVASADNWSGAVCNLGRYAMPVVPFLMAAAAVAVAVVPRRGLIALVLALAGWSAVMARALWLDPHAANDCALLLARSAIADGNVYVPNLFIRTWSDAAPGLFARILVWLGLLAVLAIWLRRPARDPGSPARMLAGTAALMLAAAFTLERWPAGRSAARFTPALELAPGATLFLEGAVQAEGDGVRAGSGDLELLARSRSPQGSALLLAEGEGVLRIPGRPAVVLRGRAVAVEIPLQPLRELRGRRGVAEALSRQTIAVESDAGVILRAPGPPVTSAAAAS